MTMHESLAFVRDLHDFMEREVQNSGPWCWPPRDLLAYNLRRNKSLYGGQVLQSFRTNVFEFAKRRGWVVEGPCQSHCHAKHVTLTTKGLEALKLMDDHGCGWQGHIGPCRHPELPQAKLTRKVA